MQISIPWDSREYPPLHMSLPLDSREEASLHAYEYTMG